MQKVDNMSLNLSSNRAAKRPHIGINGGDDDPPLDLLSLYQSDIGGRILSYASGADLCTLDILNKQFQSLTTNQWNVVTKDRFGMNNGKEGWKIGTSFLRPPVFVHNVSMFVEEGDLGTPQVAANESIVVDVSDMASNNGIQIRDASNLVKIRSISTPMNNWKVSVCGRIGSEVIVTSNKKKICALWGDFTHATQLEFASRSGYGIETIGCDTHLVVVHNGRIQLYGVRQGDINNNNNNNNTELLSLKKDIRVEEGPADEYEVMDKKLAWGPNNTHFVAGYPHKICVWKLDATNNEITLVMTIDVPNWDVTNVALAEDYIVASSKNKKVHIWNRSTGDKMLYRKADEFWGVVSSGHLCDVGISQQLPHDEEFVWPLFLSCHGNILVSTSHIGCAICIWDMKTGELIKRHNEADEQGVVEMLPVGFAAVTDIAHLKRLNAFLCAGEYENMWAFPTNQVQSESALSIRNRVDAARLERENVSDSESESESDW